MGETTVTHPHSNFNRLLHTWASIGDWISNGDHTTLYGVFKGTLHGVMLETALVINMPTMLQKSLATSTTRVTTGVVFRSKTNRKWSAHSSILNKIVLYSTCTGRVLTIHNHGDWRPTRYVLSNKAQYPE